MQRLLASASMRRLAPLVLLCVGMLLVVAPAQPHPRQPASPLATEAPHLELTVEPATVNVGDLVTVRIAYVNLGLPYTTITWEPLALAAFDPPRTMSCKYGEDASGCTVIILRAIAPGTLNIHATATGEIYDDSCACWRWSGGSDNGPAIVTIQGSRLFVPLVVVP
ncbi:MAG: hypothetical protein HGA19_00550 [Oscillochloris sp.]|nr:hypothetical protein [Oscillochloris sp.]